MSKRRGHLVGIAAGVVLLGIMCVAADAATITVTTSIQAAINAANTGDVVVVPARTYYETIDFKGKAITVTSTNPANPSVVAATIIDGGKIGKPAVTFGTGEGRTSVLKGLTITNGGSAWNAGGDPGPYISPGGGIYCRQSSPTISGNAITNNEAGGGDGNGGGIRCEGGAPLIVSNTISSNFAVGAGGGIWCGTSAAVIRGNTVKGNGSYGGFGGGIYAGSGVVEGNAICGNTSEQSTGGIYAGSGDIIGNLICDNWSPGPGGLACPSGSPNIVNNTISGNYAAYDTGPGGISVWGTAAPVIKNCIIWGNDNTGHDYADYDFGGTTRISYCVLGGGYQEPGAATWGAGNLINVDPLFAGNGDYHVKSKGGRWNPATAGWVVDAVQSPCIDAGDPTSAYSNEPQPNGGRIEIGAYGNTAQASKSIEPLSQSAASDTEASTTFTAWKTKTTLTFTPGTAGDWIVFAFAEYKGSSTSYSTRVRLTQDGGTPSEVVTEPASSTDYTSFMTVKVTTLTAAQHTFTIDYCTTNAAATARIRNARIVAVKKGALDVKSGWAESTVGLTTTLSDKASLSWTPPLQGDYLLVWSCEFGGQTSYTTRVQAKLNGTVYDDVTARVKDATSYYSFMSFAKVTCTAAAQKMTITAAKQSGSTGTHNIRHCRLVAVRLTGGRLAGAPGASSSSEWTTTSTSFSTKLTKSWTWPRSGRWLLLTSFNLTGSGTGYSTEAKTTVNNSTVCGQPMRKPAYANCYMTAGAMDVRSLGTSAHVDVAFRSTSTAYTGKMKYIRFVGLPLD